MTKRCKFLNYITSAIAHPELRCTGTFNDCPKPKIKLIIDLGCYLPEETDDNKPNAMSLFEV